MKQKTWREQTTNWPCRLFGSNVASGFMLQKSNASPIFGLTDKPLFPHSDNSLYQGIELPFTLADGNTVSPPSSTSELKFNKNNQKVLSKKQQDLINCQRKSMSKIWMSFIQIHKNSSYALTPILSVQLIKEVIKVRIIFLTNFIMENLKALTILCETSSTKAVRKWN